jgi:hypothetical protein
MRRHFAVLSVLLRDGKRQRGWRTPTRLQVAAANGQIGRSTLINDLVDSS